MANCKPNIPSFINPACDLESGRVVGLAFIHKSVHAAIYADPTNLDLWLDGIYTANIHVFQEVRGTYDGGSPINGPGIGNQAKNVISSDRNLVVAIQGVKNNEDFFNQISKSHNFRVAFVIGNYQTLLINNVDVSIYAGAPVEEGLDTAVSWSCVINWQDINSPKSSDLPLFIFGPSDDVYEASDPGGEFILLRLSQNLNSLFLNENEIDHVTATTVGNYLLTDDFTGGIKGIPIDLSILTY